MPSVLAVSSAMASASPVTIFTSTPICRAVAMVALASLRGGSKSGSTPRNCHAPVAFGSGDAERSKATRRELVHRSVDRALSPLAALAESSKMTCGAPLVTLNAALPAPLTVASVRLPTGSNGWKWVT